MNSSDTNNSSGFKTGLTWDLTPYEQQRKPHELLHDEELLISPKSLQSELTCPICLDLLRNTRTTKECLHRFCCDCIETALRSGNKECPTCRKKLISKRCLRRDENIDALITKLFPSRNDLDEFNEKILAANRNNRTKTTINHTKPQPGASVSSDDEPPMQKKKKRTSESSSSASTPTTNEIEIHLKPHSNEPNQATSTTRKILTPLNATMNHLSKFLNTRMKIEQGGSTDESDVGQQFEWFIQTRESSTLIANTTTLDKLVEQYWHQMPKPWNIFYRRISH